MKALVLKKYTQLVYEDVPIPQCGPDEVLIRVKACGICGSDIHGMDGSTGRRFPPIIMGHEASGVIAKTGENVHGWSVGERVTFDSTIYPLDDWYTRKGLYNLSNDRMVLGVSCADYRREGALAEYVAVPQHILYKIPDEVTFNQAALVEPLAVALHAAELTPISLNDSAVVIGAGVIGLCVIQILKAKGCGQIIAVDLLPERLELAMQLGATATFLADHWHSGKIQKLSEGRGADIAFDAVGNSSSLNMAIQSVRKGGTITLIGNLASTVDFSLQTVVTRQLRLQGSCAICGEYPIALKMIECGVVKVDALISKTAPLAEGAKWFKKLYEKEKGLIKVVLNP